MFYDVIVLDSAAIVYFPFNSCPTGFAYNLVAWWNKFWINTPTIGDIEITPSHNLVLKPIRKHKAMKGNL